MNKLNYINDIEKILNNLGMNGKMIADKLRKCEKYESAGLEPEQIKSFLKDFGISVVMRNTKLMNELKEYKDLEEQGLLIKLPCKVGDTVYWVWCDSEGNPDSELEEECIKYFYVDGNKGIGIATDYYDGHIGHYVRDGELVDNIRRIFLDKKEAEKALEVLEK